MGILFIWRASRSSTRAARAVVRIQGHTTKHARGEIAALLVRQMKSAEAVMMQKNLK
jgi:hypothetical protein